MKKQPPPGCFVESRQSLRSRNRGKVLSVTISLIAGMKMSVLHKRFGKAAFVQVDTVQTICCGFRRSPTGGSGDGTTTGPGRLAHPGAVAPVDVVSAGETFRNEIRSGHQRRVVEGLGAFTLHEVLAEGVLKSGSGSVACE